MTEKKRNPQHTKGFSLSPRNGEVVDTMKAKLGLSRGAVIDLLVAYTFDGGKQEKAFRKFLAMRAIASLELGLGDLDD